MPERQLRSVCNRQCTGAVMLSQLTEEVRECLRHAEECAHRASIEPDPKLQRDFIDMERRWLNLARSHQFARQLKIVSGRNKERPNEDALLARSKGYAVAPCETVAEVPRSRTILSAT